MDWHEKALILSKEGKNSGEIARDLMSEGYFPNKMFSTVYETVRSYVRVHSDRKNGISRNVMPNTVQHLINGNVIKFGLIGDTHIGNKKDKLDALQQFYELCASENVSSVYHTGDMTDGYKMRADHEYELYTHGVDEIIETVRCKYPRISGITTYFITGNHDASLYKQCGLDIGKCIADARYDLVYLGKDCAKVKLAENCIMELVHPWDGSAYAISQKSQKLIDNKYDDMPNILAIGHYHKAEYLFYKGVHCFQTGCFEDRTPFEIGKNIIPVVGGWIIEVTLSNGKIASIVPRFIPFK